MYNILKITALFYFIQFIFAMPQDHVGNFFGELLKVPEGRLDVLFFFNLLILFYCSPKKDAV